MPPSFSLKKNSENRDNASWENPLPVSVKVTSTPEAVGSQSIVNCPPRGMAWMAFTRRLVKTCVRRFASPLHDAEGVSRPKRDRHLRMIELGLMGSHRRESARPATSTSLIAGGCGLLRNIH